MSAVPKHTPGPWGLVHRTMLGRPTTIGEAFVVSPKAGPAFAYLPAGRASAHDVQEANARLVAAAPDLLAALKAALPALATSAQYDDDDAKAHEDARAAIAKAEGGR